MDNATQTVRDAVGVAVRLALQSLLPTPARAVGKRPCLPFAFQAVPPVEARRTKEAPPLGTVASERASSGQTQRVVYTMPVRADIRPLLAVVPPPKRVTGRSRVDDVRRALANALVSGKVAAFTVSLSPCVSPYLPTVRAFTRIRPPLRPQPPRLSTARRRVAEAPRPEVKAPCDLRLPTDTADVLGRQAVPPLLADKAFVPAQKPPHADGVVLLVPAQRPLPHNGLDTAIRGGFCAGRVVDGTVLLQVAVPARTVAVVLRAVAPLC